MCDPHSRFLPRWLLITLPSPPSPLLLCTVRELLSFYEFPGDDIPVVK
jgi:hypothetical protein